MFYFIIAFLVLFIALIRNELVYSNRDKAIDMVFEMKNWEEAREIHLTKNGYFKIYCSLNRWTFKQMYPDLEKARALSKNA